jgi:hypothetical protein
MLLPISSLEPIMLLRSKEKKVTRTKSVNMAIGMFIRSELCWEAEQSVYFDIRGAPRIGENTLQPIPTFATARHVSGEPV